MSPAPEDEQTFPVALRLVPFVSGLTPRELQQILIDAMPEDPFGEHGPYCTVFQWHAHGDYSEKPVPALRFALSEAIAAAEKRDAIAAIPPDLFVQSKALEWSLWHCAFDYYNGPPPRHQRPDWQPNVAGYEDLIRECPEALRSFVHLPHERIRRARAERAAVTKDRDARLQRRFDELHKTKPQLNKKQLCAMLSKESKFAGIKPTTIERLVKMK